MANIDIFGTLTNATGEPIVNASQVGSGTITSEGELMQDTINSKLMEGKIYDAEEGKWVSNKLTKATTTTLGGIRAANVREIHDFQTTQGGEDTIGNRYYGVELDKDGKAFVHVPWVYNAIPVADKDKLGGVMTGDNTGIKVEDLVIKADFDTTDYSKVEDITAYGFSTTTVASPNVVNKIVTAKLNEAIYEVLNTPM